MSQPFSPFMIGRVELKNRIMMAPMETGLANPDGSVNDQLIRFFVKRAENDVALLETGSISCAPEGRGLPKQLSCFDDRFTGGLASLVDAVHRAGARISAQLYHAGRQATSAITGLQPVGPSAIACPLMQEVPRELETAELDDMAETFARGALRLRQAGFDMIDLHLAHGYLLFSFLSPLSNQRQDQYGGSLENRMRFPLQVLRRVVEEVGDTLPVTVRISIDEFAPGGIHFPEIMEVCRALRESGAQAISISAGSYASLPYIIQPPSFASGFLAEYSAQIKALVDVPVIVAGRINSAREVERILAEEKADLVAIGRGLVCDPAFARKMQEGRSSAILECLACNRGCIDSVIRGGEVGCILQKEHEDL